MPSVPPSRISPATSARATRAPWKSTWRTSNGSPPQAGTRVFKPPSWPSKATKPSPGETSWRCRRNGLNWPETDRVEQIARWAKSYHGENAYEKNLSVAGRLARIAGRSSPRRGRLGPLYRPTRRQSGQSGRHLDHSRLVRRNQIDRRIHRIRPPPQPRPSQPRQSQRQGRSPDSRAPIEERQDRDGQRHV